MKEPEFLPREDLKSGFEGQKHAAKSYSKVSNLKKVSLKATTKAPIKIKF